MSPLILRVYINYYSSSIVFAMDSQKGGEAVSYQDFFTFIQKHASSIHLVVVSSSFEHLRDLIRGMKSNNGELGSVPLMGKMPC